MTLDPPSSTQDLAGEPLLDDDFLILSTIHSAKGLEWDAVSLIHAADGNIPSDLATGDTAQIEEERRLFYVACTRAKDHLTVTVPQRYYFQRGWQSDLHSYAQPSRFLTEETRKHMREVAAFPAEDDEPDESPLSSESVRNQIKGTWS
jgi:DNA helicase-2/ATP-dependent DNA helicase PcrA